MKHFGIIIFLVVTSAIYASDDKNLRKFPDNTDQSILIGYSGNYPILDSADTFGPSIYHPILGIRHVSENWVLGLSMHFKFLDYKSDNSKLAIWTLEEEMSYRIRLYHPVYMLTGIKFLYLYPVLGGVYPFRRRTDFSPEVGVGATVSFLYFFSPQTAFGVFADVWRGTGSRRFQGLETGVHVMFPLRF